MLFTETWFIRTTIFDNTTNGADWLHPDWVMDAEPQNFSSVNNDPPKSIYGRKNKIRGEMSNIEKK